MGFKLAELFVAITGDDTALSGTLAGVRSGLMGTVPVAAAAGAEAGASFSGAFLGAATAGLALIAAGVFKSVGLASDLNETVSKTGQVFGNSAGRVADYADEMAAKFGLVKTEVLDAASSFGLIATGMGQDDAAAAELATTFAGLAADASSFYNVPVSDALEKIRAGLTGESEPLKAFGVIMDESAVKAEAARQGFKAVGGELSQQAKLAARSAIIQRGLATATGDLARTNSGYANSSRALLGRLENAATSLGQGLMPIFEGLLGGLNAMAAGVGSAVDLAQPYLLSFSQGFLDFASYAAWAAAEVGTAVHAMGADLLAEIAGTEAYRVTMAALGSAWQWLRGIAVEAFTAIGVVFRNWRLIVSEATIRARQYILNAGEAMAWLGSAAGELLAWFGNNWSRLFYDIFNAAYTVVRNFVTNVVNGIQSLWDWLNGGEFSFNWTPLLDGFKATVDQLPAIAAPVFTDLQGEIDEIRDKMVGVEQARVEANNKAAAGAAAARGAPAPEARKKAERPGQDAAEKDRQLKQVGLAEFAKHLQEGVFGKGDAAKQTAAGVKELVKEARKGNEIAQKGGGKAVALAAP